MKSVDYIYEYEVGMIVENVVDKARYVVIETYPNFDDDYYSVANLITEEEYLSKKGRSYYECDFNIVMRIENYNWLDFNYTGEDAVIEIETIYKLK